MGGRQHRTGVSMTHSKLAFGSASQRGVHEVTSLKPARWVVMEPSKQFLHGLSFVGFLILTVNLSQVGYFFFLRRVSESRDDSRQFLSKSKSWPPCANKVARCWDGALWLLGLSRGESISPKQVVTTGQVCSQALYH